VHWSLLAETLSLLFICLLLASDRFCARLSYFDEWALTVFFAWPLLKFDIVLQKNVPTTKSISIFRWLHHTHDRRLFLKRPFKAAQSADTNKISSTSLKKCTLQNKGLLLQLSLTCLLRVNATCNVVRTLDNRDSTNHLKTRSIFSRVHYTI
jgi:hypothetical protein